MIKKFVKINGTWKFLQYNHNTPPTGFRTTDFEKINLLYGENGSGKTTLSIILHSLKGNNSLLSKKRSFDHSVPQTIEILTNGIANTLYTYNNGIWDNHKPLIEIFDIHFINENIYTGLEIQSSHKKNLFEVIFGQQGIQLKIDIQDIKDRIQNGNKTIKETTEKIQLAIENAYTASDYCNIQIDDAIDTKIVAKEAEIATAKSYQLIQTKQALSVIPQISLPYDCITATAIISQTIDTISETYLQKFKEHKEHLSMGGKEEEWLKQGFSSITDNACPFCLRTFDEEIEILEAYKQYFNEEYNTLLNSLSSLNSSVLNFNLEAQLLQADAKITGNRSLIEFWENHIINPPSLISIIDKKDELSEAFEKVKTCLEAKSKNPIQATTITDLASFQTAIDAINTIIDDFNTDISTYNQKISTLKLSAQPSISQLELDLKKLKAVKKRSEPVISTICTNLSTYAQAIIALNSQKTTKQLQLDTYSTTIFSSYSLRINQYLQSFAPYLEIRNLDSGYVGSSKEPMVKYALHINGNEIKQDDNPLYPCIKYSLSEGDKSALALAFFLTKLEVDGNIQDKIIVFDDPVSSFDLNRKSTTISNLIHFGQQSKQLFVFTHNLIFASEFWKSANQVPVTIQCSKIEFLGNTACIIEYNIETETLSSILKDSSAIKNYLINGCLTDELKRGIARCLRPALESYFHLKFFDLVAPDDWLGDFIKKVRNSTATDPFFRLQSSLTELSDVNDYSKKYHHRFNANNETEPVNDAELRTYCNRTLNLIQVI
ncbi:MAG: AAA family ATPase [Bacteroidetes bacterium]|nr:AAA family ATPase [Bacteroidota bacterium]